MGFKVVFRFEVWVFISLDKLLLFFRMTNHPMECLEMADL
jgi:hypothetical protein